MVELWNIGLSDHETYARAQQEVLAFQQQFHLSTQATKLVAVQTTVLDFIPKFENTMLLLGTYKKKSWSRFAIPNNYHVQRLTSSYVAPSLGPPEKRKADIAKIETTLRQNPADEEINKQGQSVIEVIGDSMFRNEMIDFTTYNQLRFLQA